MGASRASLKALIMPIDRCLCTSHWTKPSPCGTRTVSSNLTLHYNRVMYLLEPSEVADGSRRKQVQVRESRDGAVRIFLGEVELPARPFPKDNRVRQGDIVSHKFVVRALPSQSVPLLAAQQPPFLGTGTGPQEVQAGTPSRAPSTRTMAMILSATALAAVMLALLSGKQTTVAPAVAVVDTKVPSNIAVSPVARAVTADVAESPSAPHMFLHLTSEPPGAFVTVYGRQYGPTPAHVEIRNERIAQGSDISAVFEKSGFDPVVVTRVIEGGELRLHGLLPRNEMARAHSSSHPAPAVQPEPPTPLPMVAKAQPTQAALATPPATAKPLTAPAQPIQAPAAATPSPTLTSAAAAGPAKAAAPTKLASQSPPKSAAPAIVPSTLLRNHIQSPDYPRSARRAGIEGTVVVRVYVSPTGSVSGVDILSGPEVFHEDVRSTLMTWKYTPAKLPDGKATADSHVVQVPFKLQ